jgi:hypothetical protein
MLCIILLRRGSAQRVSETNNLIMLVFSVANSTYIQSHLNNAWDAATSPAMAAPGARLTAGAAS